MENIVFLIMRRMRRPLLTLIVVYAISVLGLVLIPGQDADGNRWYMGFFHAFYFVAYMSTTIGFGEIPFEFTDGQRLWVTFSIFASVTSWFYALGTIVALLQDKTFQEAIRERRFTRSVANMREPFYLLCGYGETGRELTEALTDRGQHVVVVDRNGDKINMIKLQNLRESVPALHGNGRKPAHLLEAGLKHDQCEAVVALTNDNETNLKIAITAKLLHPKIKVICRADSHDVEANMASFGTDYIVDPFDTFAKYLSTALQAPGLYLLQSWLTEKDYTELPQPIYPPTRGHWIICGYGRFGKAVYDRLSKEGMSISVIEATPEKTGEPDAGVVKGRGTEADTLIEAGLEKAVGLVAGTDDDANNLSIVMTAKEITSKLFVIARQNARQNQPVFDAVGADMVMHSSSIIADKIRVLLATPMLYEFMSLAVYESEEWACELVSRTTGLVTTTVPLIKEIMLTREDYPMICKKLERGAMIRLGDLITDAGESKQYLNCIALLLVRRKGRELLPSNDLPLREGDKLLFCGNRSSFNRLEINLYDEATMDYILTGEEKPCSMVWCKISERFIR